MQILHKMCFNPCFNVIVYIKGYVVILEQEITLVFINVLFIYTSFKLQFNMHILILVSCTTTLYLYTQQIFYTEKIIMVPTSTGKFGIHFPVRKKSGNFEHTGKVRGF